MVINQATLAGGIAFIALIGVIAFVLWSSCWPKQTTIEDSDAESSTSGFDSQNHKEGSYESEEQKQPWDEGGEYPPSIPDDRSVTETHEEYQSRTNWKYVTEFVDPDVPAKRADDPLPSDWYVVEQNGLDEYRSVPKPEWIENVHSEPEEWEEEDE